jgi:hypothetical protein
MFLLLTQMWWQLDQKDKKAFCFDRATGALNIFFT